jgi:outer membrane protein OmpU
MTETEGKIMKKILIATTALVATAGVAAADVSISGWAYAIVESGDALVDGGGSEVNHGGRIQFSASTQTDSGLGLSYYSRMTNTTLAGQAFGEYSRVSMSMNGMTIDVGSANGAGQSLARHTTGYLGVNDSGVGVGLSLADNRMTGALTDGGENVVARYSVGAVSVAAAAAVDGTGPTEFGVRYSDNGMTIGYAANNESGWQAFASYQMGDVTIAAGANDADTATGSVSYNVGGGLTLTAAMRSQAVAGDSWGVDASYDLGGGATLAAQFGEAPDGDKGAAIGVIFNF